MVQHTYQYILIIHQTSAASDGKLADKIELKAVISLLWLAGALWSNKQSLEESWGADRDGIEKSRLVMYQICFKILIRCILEQTRVVWIKLYTFICRNLEGISEVAATNYIRTGGITNGGLKN